MKSPPTEPEKRVKNQRGQSCEERLRKTRVCGQRPNLSFELLLKQTDPLKALAINVTVHSTFVYTTLGWLFSHLLKAFQSPVAKYEEQNAD